jgi:hypothetical protein
MNEFGPGGDTKHMRSILPILVFLRFPSSYVPISFLTATLGFLGTILVVALKVL